jgi:hypothetical protein
MIDNDFTAAMTSEELLFGEARHSSAEQSRRLAMTAGLTKSSNELQQVWEHNPQLYLETLSGAIAAYDSNKNIEELLVGCIARLVSIVNDDSELVDRALEIVKDTADEQAS